MNKKTDLRVIKTKNNLYQTLIELMSDMPFEEIKFSDICEKALVNRSTFYSHYSDKYELLSSYIDTLKDSLEKELEKNTSIKNTKEYYLEMISLFLDHVHLLENGTPAKVIDSTCDEISNNFLQMLKSKKGRILY